MVLECSRPSRGIRHCALGQLTPTVLIIPLLLLLLPSACTLDPATPSQSINTAATLDSTKAQAAQAVAMAERLISGDLMTAVAGLASSKELDQLWSTPGVLAQLAKVVPGLTAIRGVDRIVSGSRDLTGEDGVSALGHVRDLITDASKAMSSIGTPASFGKAFSKYTRALSEDEGLRSLAERADKGDYAAAEDMLQWVADQELGGAVDVSKLGVTGSSEPAMLKQLRQSIMADDEADAIWSLVHQDDPVALRYLSDLTTAYREGQDLIHALPDME